MTTERELRRLVLELRSEAQPIEGRVYNRDGDTRLERAFSGWLGLMSAIEAAGGVEERATRQKKGEGP